MSEAARRFARAVYAAMGNKPPEALRDIYRAYLANQAALANLKHPLPDPPAASGLEEISASSQGSTPTPHLDIG